MSQDVMSQDVMSQRWIRHFDPTVETLHDRLRSLREARGLSQSDVARALGYDPSYISRYEKDTVPQAPYLMKAAAFFGVPVKPLLELLTQDMVRAQLAEAAGPWPGPAIAIPDEPGMYEVITEIIAFDDLHDVARILREYRTHAGPGSPLPDHIVQGASELIARGNQPTKCPPPAGTPTSASAKR